MTPQRTRGAGAARADQGRAQDDGPGDGRLGVHRSRTSPSGSPSTSPARWSSSSGCKSRREFRDVKVSPLLVLARGVHARDAAYAGDQLAAWDEQAQEIVFKRYVNLGIAAATPRGLVVPNVKDAERLSPARPRRGPRRAHRHGPRGPDPAGRDERRHLHDHQRGRVRGRRRHADHQPRRVRDPLLRRGAQAAVGASKATRSSSARSPSSRCRFDHRHVDGEKGSRFLADVAAIMEDPATALLF